VHVTALTAERYRHALQHVRQYLGGRPLQKAQAGDLAGLYASLVRDGMAPRTVKLIHRVVHRALGQAKAWGLVRDNVAEGVNPPKAADIETKMLQPDEAAALVERLRGGPLYMIALLGLATGMRRNENRRHFSGARWGRWHIPEPRRDQSGMGQSCPRP
jgi:integrase